MEIKNKTSYTITLQINKSEKEGISSLLNSDANFIRLDKTGRKAVMSLLNIESKYSRSFDLVIIAGHTNLEKVIQLKETDNITLIELKTTKKKLSNSPKGFFFGATENEFELAKRFGENYKFCLVSLHPESKGYTLLYLEDIEKMIKYKRVQYQITLQR